MIGPSLPKQSFDHGQEKESDQDAQQSGPSTSRRVLGPTLPTADQLSGSSAETGEISSSGRNLLERQERIGLASEQEEENSNHATSSGNQINQRPDWMLAPPSAVGISDILSKDPTAALKSRGFNQSGAMRVQRTAAMPTNVDEIDNVSWTETPQDRSRRLYEEQMGIRTINGKGRSDDGVIDRQLKEERQREERVREAVEKHQASRGTSLLEQHQAKRRKDLREKDHRSHKRDRDERHSSRRSGTLDQRDSRSYRDHRHRRERSGSLSSDEEKQSRSREKHREHRRGSSHGDHRNDRHRHSKEDKYSSSKRRYRSRSRSPSSKRHEEERPQRDKEREKKREREKERKKRQRAEEEKEEKRGAPTMIWDREAALSVGGQLMDERKRMDFIKSSATLSDRFGQGTSRYM